MKFGIMAANVGPFVQPDHLEHLARTADEAGIESLWTVEHVVVPVGYRSEYPYHPSGKMPGPEHSPIPDPLIPLAFIAAVTRRVRLATGILILPQRHPAYVAKELATLDVLSGGRAMLGVGIGWLREEFDTLGIPFEERAGRTDESIRALRALWDHEPRPFEGKYYRWGAVQSNPKPIQPRGVPIVVGGHVDAAARRAARLGDGFFPVGASPEQFARLLGVLRDECARIGRNLAEIEITAMLPQPDLDAVKRQQDLGVSRLVIAPPAADKESIRKRLGELAEKLISRV